MGQMADDMISGLMCSQCGVCFEEEHGYSVLCIECWDEDQGESKIPIAVKEEL